MESAGRIIEFKMLTRPVDGSNRFVERKWRLRFDPRSSSPPTIGVKEYRFGLEIVGELNRPFPVLYRMVVWDETEGKACINWGELVIYRPSLSQVIWNVIDEGNPAQMAVLKMESKNHFHLHVFIDIPGVGVSIPVDIVKPRFALETESDATLHYFERIFNQIQDGEKDFMGASDIAIKVIDQAKKTERVFNCHRIILPIRTRYFNNLLHRRGVIQIDNVDADTMEIILRYLYTGCMTRMSKHDGGVCDLAKVIKITNAVYKFGLDDWKPYCQSVLLFDFVDDQSRREQYDLAVQMNDSVAVVCMEQLSLAEVIMRGDNDQQLRIPAKYSSTFISKD